MNHSKKSKKTPNMESSPTREHKDDSALKLEIWENEGGAIAQSNVRNDRKQE